MARLLRVRRWNGTLPALATQQGKRILPPDESRVGLVILNAGAGTAYISDEPSPDNVFPLETGGSLNFLMIGSPTNAVYAWGAALHDLRLAIVTGPAVPTAE